LKGANIHGLINLLSMKVLILKQKKQEHIILAFQFIILK